MDNLTIPIQRLEWEIERNSVELYALEQLRNVLESRKDTLKTKVFSEQACVAPITSLPTELLRHIFILGSRDDPATFPVLVSHVSCYWREISLSTSPLWSTIQVERMTRKQIEVRLERSGTRTLDVTIDLRSYNARSWSSIEASIYKILQWHHRWRSIQIWEGSWSRAGLGDLIRDICSSSCPALEEFSARCVQREHRWPRTGSLFGGSAGRLRVLQVENVWNAWSATLMENVTTFVFTQRSGPWEVALPSYKRLLDVLQMMPNLENLEIEKVGPGAELDDDENKMFYDPVVFPRLRRLRTRLDDDQETCWLLQHLLMPNLSELVVELNPSHPQPVAHFYGVLKERRDWVDVIQSFWLNVNLNVQTELVHILLKWPSLIHVGGHNEFWEDGLCTSRWKKFVR